MTVADRTRPHNWSGPRLPRKLEPLPPEIDVDLADSAHGETVPRCWNCGRPGIGRTIVSLGLTLGGRTIGRWQLCWDCVGSRNPHPDGDPLTLEATA